MEHQTGVQVPVAAAVDYFDTEALDGDMLDAFLAQIQEQQLARAHMDVNELSGKLLHKKIVNLVCMICSNNNFICISFCRGSAE